MFAVMGYDDFSSASLVSPLLTTIHMPAYEIGLKSAELMLNYQQNGSFPTKNILLDTHIVVRESA